MNVPGSIGFRVRGKKKKADEVCYPPRCWISTNPFYRQRTRMRTPRKKPVLLKSPRPRSLAPKRPMKTVTQRSPSLPRKMATLRSQLKSPPRSEAPVLRPLQMQMMLPLLPTLRLSPRSAVVLPSLTRLRRKLPLLRLQPSARPTTTRTRRIPRTSPSAVADPPSPRRPRPTTERPLLKSPRPSVGARRLRPTPTTTRVPLPISRLQLSSS